jgi:enoyl-CoA hydratase
MYQSLLTELTNNIFTITINRPEKLNSLNKTVMEELNHAIDEVYENPAIKSAIITGAGPKAFVAGADISEFLGLSRDQGAALARKGQAVFFKIGQCPKPIVAAVNGFALGGGCELALACHFRLCSQQAKFGQPEVNLGLIPGYGGTQRLTHLIGKGRSMELMMSAELITADQALQYGLVNHVTTPETLLSKTMEILLVIQSKAPLAIAGIIACVNTAVGDLPAGDYKNGFEKEQSVFGECFGTEDLKEGATAFLEKRKPLFKGV